MHFLQFKPSPTVDALVRPAEEFPCAGPDYEDGVSSYRFNAPCSDGNIELFFDPGTLPPAA